MKNKYLLIPTFIFELKDISLSDKIILGVIYTFREKETLVSNEYFTNLLELSERQISRSLHKLEELGYIKTYLKRNYRYIWKQNIDQIHYYKPEIQESVKEFNKVFKELKSKWKKNDHDTI